MKLPERDFGISKEQRYLAGPLPYTPVEKRFRNPGKIEKQVTANPETKICAIDLNLDGPIAVCTVQTAEGTILATKFIGGVIFTRICGGPKPGD
jgi:hypothetical protein